MTIAPQFFYVGGAWDTAALRVDAPNAPDDVDLVREFKGERPPVIREFLVQGGRREDDYVETGLPPITLVSDEWIEAFSAAKVIGWSTYEIELQRRRGWPAKRYAGLIVAGRCGRIENERSVLLPRISPHSGNRSDIFRGLYFDESSWDESDLFVSSDETSYLFATARIKELVESAGLRGMEFRRLNEVERFRL